MSEPKFTKGPWSVPHFAKPDTNCACGFVLTDYMMGAIATVHCSGEGKDWIRHGDHPKFVEACANANLIVAASDLYAALKETLEIAARNESGEYIERANAAMRKARGE